MRGAGAVQLPALQIRPLLFWDKPPPGPCHEVLSGLAPLQAAPWLAELRLGLADHWHLSAQDATSFTAHLPGLDTLSLCFGLEMKGFEDFIPALASSMPGLRSLIVPLLQRCGTMATELRVIDIEDVPRLLPAGAALRAVDTLRAMAVERACNGLALQIIVQGMADLQPTQFAQDLQYWKTLCAQKVKRFEEFASRMGADAKCPVQIQWS